MRASAARRTPKWWIASGAARGWLRTDGGPPPFRTGNAPGRIDRACRLSSAIFRKHDSGANDRPDVLKEFCHEAVR
jgi:hypothetical protein